MEELKEWIGDQLQRNGISESWRINLEALIMLIIVLIISYTAFWIIRKIIITVVQRFIKGTESKWDDILSEHKVFATMAHLVPVIIIKNMVPIVFEDFPHFIPFISKLTEAYLVFVFVLMIIAFLRGTEAYLSVSKIFIDKPIASYFQLTRLIIYIATIILVLSILLGRSPVYFLGAFGAMTAILLLIFKDTILGLVASVQISTNDMIRVGDWVEMPKYNADGDVIAINLNTVKIKNWDKTITTVPTYYFISDSFKNWRGMQESGGRRIKRAIYINQSSVKFVDIALREKFKTFHLIKDFVNKRQVEIEQFNKEMGIDNNVLINGRRMTNIGVFRFYVEAYLKNHTAIRQDMSLMVRQLTPTEFGLPIEVYCFTNTIAWVAYEAIQSDIFDHLLAAARHFDLEVFQSPSGSDIIKAGENIKGLIAE